MTAPQEICWQLCRKKTITRQAVNFSFSYNFCNSIMQVIGYNLYVKKLIILISTNLGGKFRQKFFTNFLGCISDQHTKNDFHNKPTNKNAMLFMDAATLYNSIHLMLLTVKKNILIPTCHRYSSNFTEKFFTICLHLCTQQQKDCMSLSHNDIPCL